ncbi:MAG: preprotein translocase subunit SecY [Syntrophomonadaceae bacterium]|jgi:preprotein translocase subunit SecY|nr:preprotein translocase subunit SecY [Bacillota bacterium]NLM89285.1 preprotein translocase subunit SecY [Syntrophomonadaceae bacterium]HAA08688.1 preprotein translocase subunit SecY [Syntrophomonas sp.]HQA49517.1 preprotein translocase subunit SecY [Syntrophomonadaceae bacterium]HQD90462.1 preprotein translocase subunit SecY [Syntrophomonadaceae bacterium]
MFGSLQQAFKIGDLRTKLLFTLMMLLVFRVGAHIAVPGINAEAIQQLISGQLFGFFDIISGGAFKRFSIFAMSITPYINASIIMSLLKVVIPRLDELSKEGEEGRKVITQYTRYGTVILAFIQALGMAFALGRAGALINPGFMSYMVIVISLTAGTVFLMWIGERITENGIGNGISLIIFAGIVSRLPSQISGVMQELAGGIIGYFNIFLFIVLALAIIAAIVAVNEGQRRLPVQYAKRVVGRRLYGGQSTFLPLKVNAAGVIPIIFAMALMMFPATIGSWAPQTSKFNVFLNTYFNFGSVAYNLVYAFLIVFFTYFYVSIIFNPMDVAENIKKYGGFVPGIRPGRPTAEYIDKILSRLTLAGGLFLALIAILPNFVMGLTGITSLWFGGTALLIVVGVALDTMKQIESHLLLRSYEGFVK